MRNRLRDRNFQAMLEALIDYADEGGMYSFISDGDEKRLVIQITVDDQAAYTAKHLAAMELLGFGEDSADTVEN